MDTPVKIFAIFVIFLVTCVFITGCTNSSSTAETANTTTALATSTTAGPLYSAGDIVKSSSASAGTAWLILSYDSAADTYSRAFVYQNSDGSWGYRMSASTETSGRASVEKMYPVKVTHVSVSAVPVKTQTIATTAVAAATTVSSTVTATAITTTVGQPSFKDMTPDEGYAGTSVSITDLVGSNFVSGTTVLLTHTGSTSINATNVAWISSSHLTCTFVIQSNAVADVWNVVITNPDGQSVTYSSYFTVHGSTSSATTTTTTSVASGTIGITSVTASPQSTSGYSQGWSGKLTIITSTTLQQGLTVTLKNTISGATISVSNPPLNSNTEILATFSQTVPAGTWNVIVTNSDGTTGTLSSGFTVS